MSTPTYSPIAPVPAEETVPLIPTASSIEAQDSAFAHRIAEEEVNAQRRSQLEANARAWDLHYRRTDPYYYGTWRGPPPQRPVVVYRNQDDPCGELYALWCFLLWFFIFLFLIIYLSYYY